MLFDYFNTAYDAEKSFEEYVNNIDIRDVLNHTNEEFKLDKRIVSLHSFEIKNGTSWRLCEEIYDKNNSGGVNKNAFYYQNEDSAKHIPYLAVHSSSDLGEYWLYSLNQRQICHKLSENKLNSKYSNTNDNLDEIKRKWNNNSESTESKSMNVLSVSTLNPIGTFMEAATKFGLRLPKCDFKDEGYVFLNIMNITTMTIRTTITITIGKTTSA